MTSWAVLDEELTRWTESGRTVTLWWRDDDAVAPSAALDRMLDLSARHAVPLSLAVIPAHVDRALLPAVNGCPELAVLTHGHAHVNNAPPEAKKCEFPDTADPALVNRTFRDGRHRLAELFGSTAQPIFVPPWNRLPDRWLPDLTDAGYAGLSRFGPRPRTDGGLHQVNTHVDPIFWRGKKEFLGLEASLLALTGHLWDRRNGHCDPHEPTGLLSHHLVQDEATWHFLAELFERMAGRDGVTWLPARGLFDHTGGRHV